ncbi:hypothetical protein HIMB100_00022740 [SAR116 cluster alpha proteobacterium HIMB100]|nr:hypothetical protein HIMB100_00022740 [SAR116 cluster alpha proteobacterium HIMB100]
MTNKNSLEVFHPFGPSIAKFTMPKKMVESLNRHIDEQLASGEADDKNLGHTLAGNVKQEFRIEFGLLQEVGLLELLGISAQTWIKKVRDQEITKFNLLDCWAVRQFRNEYNPAHIHNGHISGVGYLKLPKDFGATVQENKSRNKNGHIEFIHGQKAFLSDSITTFAPSVGDFYLFPHYMMHAVYPFDAPGERRSISFNANIDDQIYSRFG